MLDRSDEDDTMSDSYISNNSETFATPPHKKLNTSLSVLGISPVNLHSLNDFRRLPAANKKSTQVTDKMTSQLSEAYNIEAIQIDSVKQKAEDLDRLHEEMKEK